MTRTIPSANLPAPKTRIVVLGGGFGGVYTARHLERLCRGRTDVEIVLVSRDNFLVMTPLLFEVCTGTLDLRHCSFPIRAYLRTTRFVEATVQGIDLDRRVVHLAAAGDHAELPYDQLVLALGAVTNQTMIPGSEHVFTFKTLADALLLRNQLIECFERADVERDPDRKRRLLTFAIIGGGLVGVELLGELTAFVDDIAPMYQHIDRGEVRFVLLQGGDRIMPEIDAKLADYGARVLDTRRGADIRTHAAVRAIEPGKVHLPSPLSPTGETGRGEGETIETDTIVLAAGIVPNSVVAGLPVSKDPRGHILVDSTMRCPEHPEVWALGDCADSRAGRQTVSQPGPARAARSQAAGPQHRRRPGRSPAPAVHLRHPGDDGLARPQLRLRAAPQAARAWLRRMVRAADVLPDADARLEPPVAHHDCVDVRAVVPPRHRQDQPGQRGGVAPT